MNISQSFQNMLDNVVAFLPRALAFLAILIVGWIISKLIGKAVGKLLHKVGLDKAGEKSGLRRFTGKFELSDLLGKLVYYALLLFTLVLAFGAFGNNPVSNLLNQLVAWLPQLFVALVIIVVAFAIANAVHSVVSGTLSETTYGRTVARISQVAIIFFGAVAAFGQVGIATTVTTPILWTVLAMVAGVVIVGVGGGLVAPMRERWEKMLATAEDEAGKMKESAGSSRRDATESMSQTYRSGRYGSETDAQAPSGTISEPGTVGGAGAGAMGGTSAGPGLETERPMPPNEP
jgi:small-conductance mechanosensitive channel